MKIEKRKKYSLDLVGTHKMCIGKLLIGFREGDLERMSKV